MTRTYSFKSHSLATLHTWAKRLGVFRFCEAMRGITLDGDRLVVTFKYCNLDELFRCFEFLKINPVVHKVRPSQLEPGKSYRIDEFFPSLIEGTRWIEQPKHQEISGQKVFIWCEQDQVKISIHDPHDIFSVTEAAVAAAEIVEKSLTGLPLNRVEPPVDNERCFCPKYYPEYFLSPGNRDSQNNFGL